MTRLPSVTGKKLIAAMKRLGFEVVRIRGSHHYPPTRGWTFRVRLPEGAAYRSAAIPGLELDLEAFWRALPS
jgi:hypothetical protein